MMLDLLIAKNPIDIPESLVLQQCNKIVVETLSRISITLHNNILASKKKDLINMFRPQAMKIIKSNLLLSVIAKKQKKEFVFETILQMVLDYARLS